MDNRVLIKAIYITCSSRDKEQEENRGLGECVSMATSSAQMLLLLRVNLNGAYPDQALQTEVNPYKVGFHSFREMTVPPIQL